MCKLACAPIKDSDQPAHLYSLIIVFDGHSMGSQRSNVSSGRNLRLSVSHSQKKGQGAGPKKGTFVRTDFSNVS